jgi:SAM-dependent methyltransferase
MNVRPAFDDLAESYAEFRTGYSPELYDALSDAGIAAPARVLDLACGTGIVTQELAERGCSVVGLDVSEGMLAKAHVALRDFDDVSFVLGAAEEMPFDDASFDAATCAQSFHWFDEPRAFAELARVVRPGGTIAIWWKSLMRGDAMWLLREEAARDAGVEPTRDITEGGFPAFDRAPLEGQRMRVIPWLAEMPVERFLGYERSRERARAAYGERLRAYLDGLEQRLAARNDRTLSLNYIQYLYLASVPLGAPADPFRIGGQLG